MDCWRAGRSAGFRQADRLGRRARNWSAGALVMSLRTNLPDFDNASWGNHQPDASNIVVQKDFGVLRQSFSNDTGRFDVSVPPLEQHVLVHFIGQTPGEYEVSLDRVPDDAPGKRLRNTYVLPVGVTSRWRGPVSRQHQCLHFHFSSQWLVQVAEESEIATSASQLGIQAGTDDPPLDGLLRAITAVGDDLTTCYAEHWSVLVGLRLLRTAPRSRRLSMAPWRLARALALAEAHLDQDVSLSDLAAAAGLSRFHFSRAFREAMGEPPHAHVRRLRCERAAAMMMNTTMTLAEVAQACGFAHQAHFTTAFRRVYGTTPGRWRADRMS
ncbi:MAG: AraC family transcriptional regulator [Alphaproteobacteria bacterium]|nr:MAG: AraC family transcriptional regulator [Alphaproteobacteria bacterium]